MKKFPKKYIALQTLSLSISLLIFLICFAVFGWIPDEEGIVLYHFSNTMLLIFILIGLGIIALSYIYSFIYYKKLSYEMNETEIVFNYGVIFKCKNILPYSKINNIKTYRNVLHWIFGLEVLKLDSGASFKGENPEIRIVDTPDNIKNIENEIRQKLGIDAVEEKNSNYKFSFGKIFGFSFIRYGYLVSLYLSIFVSCTILFSPISEENSNLTITDSRIWWIVLLVFVLINIAIALGCILKTWITFFHFTISKDDTSINLSYGLFEKKNNTINIKKIRAIKICQSFTQRILKTATIKVEVIGFGATQNKKEIDVVIPYLKENEISNYIEIFFKEWDLSDIKVNKPKKNTYIYYLSIPFVIVNLFILPILYAFLLTLDASFLIPIFCLVINCFVMFISFTKQKAQSLGYNKEYLIITNGYLSRKTTILNKNDIVIIQKLSTPLREKEGLCTYSIYYFNTYGDSVESVSVITGTLFEELISLTKI